MPGFCGRGRTGLRGLGAPCPSGARTDQTADRIGIRPMCSMDRGCLRPDGVKRRLGRLKRGCGRCRFAAGHNGQRGGRRRSYDGGLNRRRCGETRDLRHMAWPEEWRGVVPLLEQDRIGNDHGHDARESGTRNRDARPGKRAADEGHRTAATRGRRFRFARSIRAGATAGRSGESGRFTQFSSPWRAEISDAGRSPAAGPG